MNAVNKASWILEMIAKWLAILSTAVMWLVMCYAVFMRYLFSDAPVWSDELCRYCLVWMSFYGGAVALRRRSLANMNLLVNLFPPKIRKWINIVVSILCLILLTAFTVWSVQTVTARSVQIQTSPAMGIPLPIVYSCLPIGLGMMTLQQLVLIIIDIQADPEQEEVQAA